MVTKLIIASDLCITPANEELFIAGNIDALFHDIAQDIQSADLAIANLECVLTSSNTYIKKTGAYQSAHPDCITGIKKTGFHVLALANNHILDCGQKGLQDTISTIQKHGLNFVGAGCHLQDARKLLIQPCKDLNIGIVAMAEHEFSLAEKNKWGANPLDPIDFVRVVKENKGEFDFLVVLLHGGNEHFAYPSPRLQNQCRFFVEMGADLVICQHSHVSGSEETYLGKKIIYGQGNFLFDWNGQPDHWYKGFLLSVEFDKKKNPKYSYIPYTQSNGCIGVKKMDQKSEAEFLQQYHKRSEMLKNQDFLEHEWKNFCKERAYDYLSNLRGHNKFLKFLNRRTGFVKYFYNSDTLANLENVIRCEAHRDVLDAIFDHFKDSHLIASKKFLWR